MSNRKVFVLTAIKNDLAKTRLFLASLKKQYFTNFDIFIVDDGSIDGSFEYIKSNYPKVNLIKGNGNLWWAGSIFKGINRILETAKDDDYILIINNDCTFGKTYISSLVNVAVKNSKYIVGSYILDKNSNEVWDVGVHIEWDHLSFYEDFKRAKKDIKEGVKVKEGFDTLPSKGTLFPVGLINKIGNFDMKNFPHYLSDYEFFYRAKKAGYVLVISYESMIRNDIKRTGLSVEIDTRYSPKEYLNLLFSKKSRVNIIDHFNFVRIHSPMKYKLRNYVFIIKKILHYLLHIYPFTVIPSIIAKIKKVEGKGINN